MADSTVSWPRALAWRLRRQGLDPIGDASVAEVVRGLGAIQAQHDAGSELSIRARRARSEPGEVARALADGRLIKTFAFRGATHLMTPEDAGIYLALRASSRMWELPSWRSYYGLEPSDWPAFREVVRDALGAGPMTIRELGAAVTSHAAFAHLGFAFGEGKGSLVKPLAWLGEMSFGPPRDGQATFQRLVSNPRWAGIPDLEEAGPRAVEDYVRAYGPTTPDHLQYWLGEGLSAGGQRILAWIDVLGDRLAPVDVEGEARIVLAADLEALLAASPSTAVRLLPAYDQWVLGPGTADPHVVPPAHRAPVSRGAAVVLVGGVVAGTWSISRDAIKIDWFADGAPAPKKRLADEVERVATMLNLPLKLSVQTT